MANFFNTGEIKRNSLRSMATGMGLRYLKEMDDTHPVLPSSKVGVLLINLGTPDGTGYWDIRRYLSEFLSDRRVIEMSPLFWQPILQGIILSIRPNRSGQAYKRVWNFDEDESPLRTITREQTQRLSDSIGSSNLIVDWGMRYGSPSIAQKLTEFREKGCDRILLAALYPQYSATTTATAYDKAFQALQKMRWQPAIRTLPPYHDNPGYIDALKTSVEKHLSKLQWEPDVILTSFHGLPVKYFRAGDPYHCYAAKTSRLLGERLDLGTDRIKLTFQSRFGPAAWLEPYTDDVLAQLAQGGKKNVVVITPGFSADCLETLDEIENESREHFMEAGGENFSVVPCLNASDESISMLEKIIQTELGGWCDNRG